MMNSSESQMRELTQNNIILLAVGKYATDRNKAHQALNATTLSILCILWFSDSSHQNTLPFRLLKLIEKATCASLL